MEIEILIPALKALVVGVECNAVVALRK